ncbi:MAG: hypothetical protein D6704_06465 [Nitrospirae bacterium]|nr:MAG: hypothetical protein D6704_06465 [Nitrospirota bacterium]
MEHSTLGVILVGHGGIPKDYPSERVAKLKRLETQRKAAGLPATQEERELDQQLRHWPRTPETDPYQAGLEALAAHLQPLLNGAQFCLAYNEYCTPTLREAVEQLIARGVQEIIVVSTMYTPGGSHAEFEIPAELAELRAQHPGITLTYAWPFDLAHVARMLAEHIQHFQSQYRERESLVREV